MYSYYNYGDDNNHEDEEEDDVEKQQGRHDHLETVPLTPRESTESTVTLSTSSSTQSRSVYLSFFRSSPPPPAPLPVVAPTTSTCALRGAQNTLYPVREQLQETSDDDDDDDIQDTRRSSAAGGAGAGAGAGGYLSDPFWRYGGGERDVWTRTRNQSSNPPIEATDSGSVFQSVHSSPSLPSSNNHQEDDYSRSTSYTTTTLDYTDNDNDNDNDDMLSTLSSSSHLFGENLVRAASRDAEEGRQRAVVATRTATTTTPRPNYKYNNTLSTVSRLFSTWMTPRGGTRQQHYNHKKGKRLTLSPRSRNLQDLNYLTAAHKNKVQQLHSLLQEQQQQEPVAVEVAVEHFDFCLILQPQEVYGFWAALLDFREELLGPETVQAMELQWIDNSSNNNYYTNTKTPSHQQLCINASATDDTDNEDDDDDDDDDMDMYLPQPLSLPEAETPKSGSSVLRRRSGGSAVAQTPDFDHRMTTTEETPCTIPRSGIAAATTARKSVFERAVGSPESLLRNTKRLLDSTNNNNVSFALDASMLLSTPAASTITSTLHHLATTSHSHIVQQRARRRWGPQAPAAGLHTPSMISPPIRSLTRGSSMTKRPIKPASAAVVVKPPQQQKQSLDAKGGFDDDVVHVDDDIESAASASVAGENDDPNVLRMQDIPPQRFARGIAARTNGMLPFLSALRRGIVLRKHRPGKEACFCRLHSDDGGDTIRFTIITEHEEAMNAFKEQRVRYNKIKYNENNNLEGEEEEGEEILAQHWSCPSLEDAHDNKKFIVPDYVAKQLTQERTAAMKNRAKAFSSKVVHRTSGTIKASDIAVVHPATFNDPRCSKSNNHGGELGTATFRRSKSAHNPQLSFSLVMRTDNRLNSNQVSIADYEDRWLTGQGSGVQFKYHDFEAATLGEYWLVFRGFLLLHRDAAVGRFAEHRAAGIGSHYNRLELEQREKAAIHTDDENNNINNNNLHNRLHVDEFHEPVTVGCLEKLVVKMRKLDTTHIDGYTLPSAVPPPSDYFLGFRSPGTAIWSRLRQAGLETSRVYSLDPNRVMIKIRCPPERLMDVAAVLRLKLKTRGGDGTTFEPFREDMIDMYQSLDDPLESPPDDGYNYNSFPFRSSLRQTIIDFIVCSRIRDSGAELSQNTDLGKMIQARVPLHMHGKLDAIYRSWVFFWRCENWENRGPDGGRSMEIVVPSSNTNAAAATTTTLHETDAIKALSDETGSTKSSASNDSPDSKNQEMPHLWKRVFIGCFYQPLDSIEQYFGEEVTFYFAWLEHTALHLVFLSIVGLVVFAFQMGSGNWDHPLRPVFATIIMLWTFIVLLNWRKRANFLSYRWGTMDYREKETSSTRPQFRGNYALDDITGEWVVTYPKWKRWLKYCLSFPLALLFTTFALYAISWVHMNRDLQMANYIDQKTNPGSDGFQIAFELNVIGMKVPVPQQYQLTQEILLDGNFWLIMLGLPSLLGLCLPLLNLVLMKISVALNDFENYRTESEYRTFLIIKVISFRFVCYFATLYYYAFVSIGSEKAIENGLLRVATGVLVYTTVAKWWDNFLQICFPIAITKIRMHHRRNRLREELRDIELEEEEISRLEEDNHHKPNKDLKKRKIKLVNKRLLLEQAQDDMWLEVMLPMHDSFPEYIQAVVGFTFVSCFSVALPITPLLVLFNYLLSMRLDAYKICKLRKRPLAEKTGGLGVWEHVLHIIAVISVLTNCWLMGFTTTTFYKIGEEIGQVGLFAIVVGWEHIMLLIKYVMHASISPLPKSVRDAMKRDQHFLELQRSDSMQVRRLQHERESQLQDEDDQNKSARPHRRSPTRPDATPRMTSPAAQHSYNARVVHFR